KGVVILHSSQQGDLSFLTFRVFDDPRLVRSDLDNDWSVIAKSISTQDEGLEFLVAKAERLWESSRPDLVRELRANRTWEEHLQGVARMAQHVIEDGRNQNLNAGQIDELLYDILSPPPNERDSPEDY